MSEGYLAEAFAGLADIFAMFSGKIVQNTIDDFSRQGIH